MSPRDRWWEYHRPSELLAGGLQVRDVIQVKDPYYSRVYLPPEEMMKISQKVQKNFKWSHIRKAEKVKPNALRNSAST